MWVVFGISKRYFIANCLTLQLIQFSIPLSAIFSEIYVCGNCSVNVFISTGLYNFAFSLNAAFCNGLFHLLQRNVFSIKGEAYAYKWLQRQIYGMQLGIMLV